MPLSQSDASTLIIVPAYNESGQIAQVIQNIKLHVPHADIVVVNDGSKDDTLERARQTGVAVLDLPYNLGIGGAVQTGYRYARKGGYAFAVQIDGDGQHDPAELDKLMQALQDSGADMAVGSRFLHKTGYQSTRMRQVGIRFLSGLVTRLTGRKATDTTSGFRVCGRKAIALFADRYPTDYPEVEALVLLHKHGLRFVECPVSMRPRLYGQSSITALKSAYYMIKVTLAVLLLQSRRLKAEETV
ncbi:glycosyltransferase family 2 protein [Paenibacillus sp. MBLB4367]|uniref:glycosyltransferase family 2 protein n=1 Tax=Paenibacillus sp. MBLB4367 TaxID=3384767 RepID=UPI003907F922